jgi:hypothetical protein
VCACIAIAAPAVFVATQCYGAGGASGAAAGVPNIAGYARDESLTYLTVPEWSIVYASEEYARFVTDRRPPSEFPYVQSVRQYWKLYRSVCHVTRREYPFNASGHVMLGTIGLSFTIENLIKGLYEKSIGRTTEWLSSRDTPEDAFAAKTAVEYGAFMHMTPWYRFPFAARLEALWNDIPLKGPHALRKWERRLALSAEYGAKAVYGWMIGKAVESTDDPQPLQIHARVVLPAGARLGSDVNVLRRDGPSTVVRLPRYEAFTQTAGRLLKQGVRFSDIAGNQEIAMTALVPRGRAYQGTAQVITSMNVLNDATLERVVLRSRVDQLQKVVGELEAIGGHVEHLYDY